MSDFLLSEDSNAILLLCGIFGSGTDASEKPLTLYEYNQVVNWLNRNGYRPSDILREEIRNQISQKPISDISLSRLENLISRGAALAFAMERWTNKGIWVKCRSDEDYPQRLRSHLKHQAPPVLFGIGEQKLVHNGGLAIVGSRNIDEKGSDFAREIARRCAEEKISVISGGAKGVDQVSMNSSLESGGKVVGVLADHLLKASLPHETREFIRSEVLTLISPYHPESSWSVPNAMNRNKIIYGLSDYALVVSSDYQTGGTWAGATEELRRENHIPVFVRLDENSPKGNSELVKKGGVPLTCLDRSQPLRDQITVPHKENRLPGLQSEMFDTEEKELQHQASALNPLETKDTGSNDNIHNVKLKSNSIFDAIWPVIESHMTAPIKVDELAIELSVIKSQLKEWLKEASTRGLVKKKSNPVRYVLIPKTKQNSLFDERK